MKIYWINEFKAGKLGMMTRPRGYDWLEDDILKLKRMGVGVLISLLEREEIAELGLMREGEVCEREGITFHTYPMVDRGVPSSVRTFLSLVKKVNCNLRQGDQVVVHCRMGTGRSALLAAALLIRQGMGTHEAFDVLGKSRRLSVPDTEEQIAWIAERVELLRA